MSALVRLRNPLQYPGGPFGFDPTHPAAIGLTAGQGLSCIVPNLSLGARGLAPPNNNYQGGGVSAGFNAMVGFALNSTGTGGPAWPVPPAPSAVTFGAIFVGGSGTLITLGKGFPATVIEFYIFSGQLTIAQNNNTSFSNSIGAPFNVPLTNGSRGYFAATSYVSGGPTAYFVLTDLLTGQMWSGAVASSVALATPSPGQMGILDDVNNGNRYSSFVAAAMFNPNPTSFGALQMW